MLPLHGGWLAGIFYFFIRYGFWGLLLLSALDSSFLALPFANDIAVIVLSSLHRDFFWYAVAATLGSVIGSYAVYWVGQKGGETFIRAHVSAEKYQELRDRTARHGPFLLAAPAIFPPPFPYTAWVIAAGALEVPRARFLTALGAIRAIRFFAESILAVLFGSGIVHWLATPSFRYLSEAIVVLAILASAYSVFHLVRAMRRSGRRPAVAEREPDKP